ncbi:MAG: hypothetical protein AAGG69_15870 [Pseudomonadota bacterium]
MTAQAVPTDPNTVGGDVLALRRAAGADIPQLRGSEFVTVRTFHYLPDGNRFKRTELTGVSCVLEGEGYTANVVTPAQAQVPDYGFASPAIRVQCNKDGYKPSFKNITAFDATKAARMNASGQGGLIGVLGMGIINAADKGRRNDFKYPLAMMIMNLENCEQLKVGCRSR